MRVERVVDSGAPIQVERKSERCPSCPNAFLVALELFGRRTILLRNVLANVLSLRRHLRVEFERLEMNVGGRFIADTLERLFERSEPDHAPGAGDIGHEVDLEVRGHWDSGFTQPCADD